MEKKDRKYVLDKLSDYCGNDCEKDSCYKCYIDELIEYLCEE